MTGPEFKPVLLTLGGALFFGTVGARLFHRVRFPMVVGYIIIGILIGESWLGWIDKEMIEHFEPFNAFALGIIGFTIGGELHRDVFVRYGRQLVAILLAEGLAACLVVGSLTGAVTGLLTGDWRLGVTLGMLLGAIAAATAPAATVRVLRETRARGPLTRTVFAMVALDDGLALMLFTVVGSIAMRIYPAATGATAEGGLLAAMGKTVWEILGAAGLGAGAGFLLNWILRRGRDHDRALTYIIGMLTLVIGLSRVLHVESILAAMALGIVLINRAPRRSGSAFEIVERFAPPIYVLFFVLVGAHLHLGQMDFSRHWWLLVLLAAYIVGLVVGKVAGSYLGGRWTGAPAAVRKYLGLCMLCQAGVAVALAVRGAEVFDVELADGQSVGAIVITVIMGAIFVLELLGPPLVKVAVTRAGEAGLDITEEELMDSYTVADMVDRSAPVFQQGAPMALILRTISDTEAETYPVVDNEGRLAGVIHLGDLKQGFGAEGLTMWLVAFDLMRPAHDTVTEAMPLADAVDRMRDQELEAVPVLADHGDGDGKLAGMLELRKVNRTLSQEIVRRRQLAETGMTTAQATT